MKSWPDKGVTGGQGRASQGNLEPRIEGRIASGQAEKAVCLGFTCLGGMPGRKAGVVGVGAGPPLRQGRVHGGVGQAASCKHRAGSHP